MAVKTVVAGSTVSASQLKDFFRQIDDGSINGRNMQAILEHRDPWAIPSTFDLVTAGISGEGWIARLEQGSWNVGDYAKQLLRNKKFVATNGVLYKLAIIKGEEFEEDTDRITSNIREEAARRGYLTPSPEMSPYLRELISDEDLEKMGLTWLVVMHEAINDSDGDPRLLGLNRHGRGRWLDTFRGPADRRWSREAGFVFLVPQV